MMLVTEYTHSRSALLHIYPESVLKTELLTNIQKIIDSGRITKSAHPGSPPGGISYYRMSHGFGPSIVFSDY